VLLDRFREIEGLTHRIASSIAQMPIFPKSIESSPPGELAHWRRVA